MLTLVLVDHRDVGALPIPAAILSSSDWGGIFGRKLVHLGLTSNDTDSN